jgi:hypothetical protein
MKYLSPNKNQVKGMVGSAKDYIGCWNSKRRDGRGRETGVMKW